MPFVHCIICQQLAVKMGNAGSHRRRLMMPYRLDNKRVYQIAGLAQFLITQNSSPPTADKI
jgi:hypothetical protein